MVTRAPHAQLARSGRLGVGPPGIGIGSAGVAVACICLFSRIGAGIVPGIGSRFVRRARVEPRIAGGGNLHCAALA